MKRFVLAVAILFSLSAFATLTQTEQRVRLIANLLDYLYKDYEGAISAGKIINPFEYAEQIDFAEKVVEEAKELKSPNLIKLSKLLQKLILEKKELAKIQEQVAAVRTALNSQFKVVDLPVVWPSLNKGKKIFSIECSSCHGIKGDGRGPSARGLIPAPTNFTNQKAMVYSTPARIYNTLLVGIPNTAMPSFAHLPSEDLWALSFYVSSLRYPTANVVNDPDMTLLEQVTLHTDHELIEKLFRGDSKAYQQVAQLRHISFDETALGLLRVARFHLTRAMNFYKQKDFAQATTAAIKAYLEGVEPLEPRLRATNIVLVNRVESAMTEFRNEIKKENNELKVQKTHQNVRLVLSDIEKALNQTYLSPSMAFSSAMAIIVREGVEAILVISILLSVLQALGGSVAVKWVHAGWLFALALGGVGWFLSGYLLNLSGIQREGLEAGISILASGILLYMGFWLHRHIIAERWKRFLTLQMKGFVESQKFFGLFILSFLAVFREIFEIILFLRAITLETDPQSQSVVGLGVAAAVLVVLVLGFILVRFSRLIPIRALFLLSSVIIALLAVILMGQGVHGLQELGIVSVTSLPWDIRVEKLGVFPSWECFISQVIVGILSVMLWQFRPKSHSHSEPNKIR